MGALPKTQGGAPAPSDADVGAPAEPPGRADASPTAGSAAEGARPAGHGSAAEGFIAAERTAGPRPPGSFFAPPPPPRDCLPGDTVSSRWRKLAWMPPPSPAPALFLKPTPPPL